MKRIFLIELANWLVFDVEDFNNELFKPSSSVDSARGVAEVFSNVKAVILSMFKMLVKVILFEKINCL